MAPHKGLPIPSLNLSIVINAPPRQVLRAFFEADALGAWWHVVRSVTTPRAFGPYAVEWPPADFRDDIVGRLGGVFRGTVMQFDPGRGFFVADAYWLPPDGEPIGPMALEITCDPELATGEQADRGAAATRVTVHQSGFEESPRWRRYYEIAGIGWPRALASLKQLLENRSRS